MESQPTYADPAGTVTDALERLRDHITQVPQRLINLSLPELTEKAPGKWSRLEVIGHLIDSAVNNLKRFTDAQFAPGPYLIQRYDQDNLVRVNRYHDLPMLHLLTLWGSLNTQILYVAHAIPAATLARPIWFAPADAPDQTLGWLIVDYVAHLEHHLKTLL